jgi:hypothetical protein
MGIAEQTGYRAYTNGEHNRPGQARPLRDAVAERFEALERRVAELERNAVRFIGVTADVTPKRDVTTVTRNGNAERQRRYRERKRNANTD